MSKKTLTLIIIVIIALIGGAFYWFFLRSNSPNTNTSSTNQNSSSFSTFNRTNSNGNGTGNQNTTNNGTSTANSVPIPVLRELSTTPIGGMTASTTASSTIVRWMIRGIGRVYQASSDSLAVTELSNTTVPHIYETYWDKNATDFILRSLNQDDDTIINFYATLYPLSEPTSLASTTPFELRGAPLPPGIIALAVSPAGNQLFTLQRDITGSGGTIGYTAAFNGAKKTVVFSTPLTALNVEWPEANTIALTTKGSSVGAGFLYFVSPKGGILNTILHNIRGLDTLTSKDATKVLYTGSTANGISTSVYDVKTGTSQSIPFSTMPAEKCVWSTLQKNIAYCAVPFQIPTAAYPDAWYQGTVSFNDSIWEIDTTTGEAHLISDLTKASGVNIDAINLVLDPHENYLYFMNKKDLTLWSLELNG